MSNNLVFTLRDRMLIYPGLSQPQILGLITLVHVTPLLTVLMILRILIFLNT